MVVLRIKYLVFFLTLLNNLYFFSQESKPSPFVLAEKIYLQTDKEVYPKNSTIWFTAVVTTANNHFPTSFSNILNIELLDSNGEILETKKIEITEGFANGVFTTSNKLVGNYWLRAYTRWNKNFGSNFLSDKKITIYDQEKKFAGNIFNNISVLNKDQKQKELFVEFDTQKIDTTQIGKLYLNLQIDQQKQKQFTLNKNKNKNTYSFKHEFKNQDTIAKVEFITNNGTLIQKVISLNREIDLQFFPESGVLIEGISSRIGVKAVDVNGKGVNVNFQILDDKKNIVKEGKTNNLGMSSIILENPRLNEIYTARIVSKPIKNEKGYKFPKIEKSGATITLNQQKDSIFIEVNSKGINMYGAYLDFSTRGLPMKRVSLKKENFNLKFYKNEFLEGISIVTLKDKSNNIIAERLFYVNNKQQRLPIKLLSEYGAYENREITKLKIKPIVFGEEKTVNAIVRVVLKDELGNDFSLKNNILSYLLLDSDLKGNIENPGYYFSKNKEKDLDDLMLTQGWRNYKYVDKLKEFSFSPEKNIEVKGEAKFTFGLKKEKNVDLMLFPFFNEKSPKVFFTKTDIPGTFTFDLGKIYGEQLNAYIKKVDKKNKLALNISLNKEKPFYTNNYFSLKNQISTIVKDSIVLKAKKRIEEEKDFLLLKKGTILLNEVTVKSKLDIPKRDEMIEIYGEPDIEIEGEEIVEKKEKWSPGLLHVLKFNFSDKILIERSVSDNRLYVKAVNNFKGTNFIAVDGIFVRKDDYNLLELLSSEEVVRFEVVSNLSLKAYRQAFLETNGVPPKFGPFDGNLISIYTKTGKGIHYAVNAKRLDNIFKIPVLSQSKEYYTPKYDYKMTSEDWSNFDNRTLLYWKPKLKLNNKEFTEVSFYNSDLDGKVIVILEAISDDGKIGFQTLEYNLIKR